MERIRQTRVPRRMNFDYHVIIYDELQIIKKKKQRGHSQRHIKDLKEA